MRLSMDWYLRFVLMVITTLISLLWAGSVHAQPEPKRGGGGKPDLAPT